MKFCHIRGKLTLTKDVYWWHCGRLISRLKRWLTAPVCSPPFPKYTRGGKPLCLFSESAVRLYSNSEEKNRHPHFSTTTTCKHLSNTVSTLTIRSIPGQFLGFKNKVKWDVKVLAVKVVEMRENSTRTFLGPRSRVKCLWLISGSLRKWQEHVGKTCFKMSWWISRRNLWVIFHPKMTMKQIIK